MEADNTEMHNEGEHVRTGAAIEYQCCFSETLLSLPILPFYHIVLAF